MTEMLRIRRRDQDQKSLQQIGSIDYVCLGDPAGSVSYLSEPIKVFGDVGLGTNEVCIDQNHGSHKIYETGGPLFLSKVQKPVHVAGGGTYLSYPGTLPPGASTHNGFEGQDWRSRYTGGFVLSPEWVADWYPTDKSSWPNRPVEQDESGPDNINPDDLSSLGPRAYAKLRPKVNVVSGFQTVVESRDIPSTLRTSWKGAKELWETIASQRDLMPKYARAKALRSVMRFPKKASEHFLNTAFGWGPLVGDTRDVCNLVLFWSEHVEKARQRNDRWRQVTFHETVDAREDTLYSTTGTGNFASPSLGTSFVMPGSGRFEIVRQLTTKIWYKGSVRQYYPEFDASLMNGHPGLATVAQAIRLGGLEVNPVNIYKVLPWTWLVDWFVNVGDNIQALQDLATDAVAFRYVYVMRETARRILFRSKWTGVDGAEHSCEWEANHTVKARFVGQSPFGFSMPPGGLSGKQQAIVAALGLGGTRFGGGRVVI